MAVLYILFQICSNGMPEFSSKPPYIKQISIYFRNKDYKKAFLLSREFADAFPEDMSSHFLLAKSAFWLDDFHTAEEESTKAFNLSKGADELAVTGILRACTYYRLKKFKEGIELLNLLKTKLPQREEIAKLKFIFALALHDEQAALRHLESLYEINENAASELTMKLLGRYAQG
jgi:tetratricopeptide (TPR) repeat protein